VSGDWKSGKYNGQGHLVWEGAVYDGAFAEGTFHGRGIKKDATTGKILQQGTWNMGRFVLAATPTKILQELEKQKEQNEADSEGTDQINAASPHGATPSTSEAAAISNNQSTPGGRLPVVAPTIDTPGGHDQLAVVEPTLDASISNLTLDDSDHAVQAGTNDGGHEENSSNDNNNNDDDGGKDEDQRAPSPRDHGEEPPVILDDGAELPPAAHLVELE
jgi:hypothetical protein